MARRKNRRSSPPSSPTSGEVIEGEFRDVTTEAMTRSVFGDSASHPPSVRLRPVVVPSAAAKGPKVALAMVRGRCPVCGNERELVNVRVGFINARVCQGCKTIGQTAIALGSLIMR